MARGADGSDRKQSRKKKFEELYKGCKADGRNWSKEIKETEESKFKSKKHSTPSFYQDNIKIQFTDTHVKVEGFSMSKKQNKQKKMSKNLKSNQPNYAFR